MAHPLNTKKDAAVVIGGVNMDIWGRPTGALVKRDSNPGNNLRLLGMNVAFVTALGDDLFGRYLMDSCTGLGLDMQYALVKKGGHSSSYLFVTEEGGDMAVAINDMDICAALTPDFFEELLPKLKGFGAMVLDANLPEESLDWLCAHARLPLYADTVSAAKAKRLLPQLRRLRAIKTNALEAEALTGERDPEKAAARLTRLWRRASSRRSGISSCACRSTTRRW